MSEKKAKRFNHGKPDLSYIIDFLPALTEVARVMEYGATKYERDNWKLAGKDDSEYISSGLRHLKAFRNDSEQWDPESGCHHLAHLAWNVLALLQLNYEDLLEMKEDERLKQALLHSEADA